MFSQDTGAAGIATAAKIFHRSPVTSGQRPWFAAVLFPLGNLELEAQEEPGSYSPVLCRVRHNTVYGPFHERTVLQLKTSSCFLLQGDSPSLSMSLMVSSLYVISVTSLFPYVLAPASALISVAVLLTAPSSGIYLYGDGSCLLFPLSYTGLAFQSSS